MASLTELEARQAEIRSRLQEIDAEHDGEALPETARSEWNELNTELDANATLIEELEARTARVAALAGNRNAIDGAHFNTPKPGVARGEDIYDLSTVRSSALTDPDGVGRELRDRAMRAVETAVFPTADTDQVRGHVARLLDTIDGASTDDSEKVPGELARRILVTGSPAYKRAFGKYLKNGNMAALTNEEARAMSVGTGSAGGFAIVFTLDPTIIPTSNLSVNPYRAISRNESIVGTNEWRGVTSAGVTAAYATEGTEASDNSPTLAQPALIVQRAQCFVPVSIELTQDLPSLQASLARLIQDAKDDLEATQFTTGTGTPPAPAGVITGATTTTAAAGVASFAIADLFTLEQALGPRFRPRASMVGNRAIFNFARQFDTAGGSGVWSVDIAGEGQLQAGLANQVPRGGDMQHKLIGYPTYEATAMASVKTTGSKILNLGDFSYFKIVDRVGMDVEVIPHLFGAANRFPTGQRGIYAYWRNTSKVLDPNAFRVLVTG